MSAVSARKDSFDIFCVCNVTHLCSMNSIVYLIIYAEIVYLIIYAEIYSTYRNNDLLM